MLSPRRRETLKTFLRGKGILNPTDEIVERFHRWSMRLFPVGLLAFALNLLVAKFVYRWQPAAVPFICYPFVLLTILGLISYAKWLQRDKDSGRW